MKKIACFLLMIALGVTSLMAQTSETLNYQAVVRDQNNKLVTEQSIPLDISISVNSTVKYSETRTVTSNKNGMVSFAIGDHNRSTHSGELGQVGDWKHAMVTVVYHLHDDQGGNVTTTDSITAVPYALQADSASRVSPTYISNAIADSIAEPTSVINLAIDTMIQNYISGGSGSSMDCDGVAACILSNDDAKDNIVKIISDTTANGASDLNHIIDTIVSNNLNGYSIKDCDDVAACILSNDDAKDNIVKIISDTTANGASDLNHIIDTIVSNNLNGYSIKDCDDVAACILSNDDAKDNIIKIVSDTIANGGSDLNHIIDTIAANAANSAHLQSDWTQTDATAQDYIKNKPTNLATTDGDNNFTGDNTFAGDNIFTGENRFSDTVVVPSGFDIDTTNASNCKDLAVNACDLFTVFDSLQRRFDKLEDEIARLRDTIRDLRAATPPTWISLTPEPTATTIQATATFNDGGATITNYHYCISTNADMTGQTCYDSESSVYNFTGLTPYTQYYLTVSGTNMLGSDTSDIIPCKTPAKAPTAGTPTVAESDPNGFTYTLPDITDGGAPNVQVKFCYGEGTDCSTVTYVCFAEETKTAGTYTRTVTGLNPGSTYCMKTEVSNNNGDSVLYVAPITYKVPTVTPTLGLPDVVDKTSRSFDVEVPINDNGGAPITTATICAYTDAACTTPAAGICCPDVTITDDKLSGTIPGLQPATCYYIKATATNDLHTATSTTIHEYCTDPEPPTLGTPVVTGTASQTGFSASVPVTSTGGAAITGYTLKAYTNASCTGTPVNATGVTYSGGNITGTFTGLSANTKYYYTASATNSAGSGYSDTSNVTLPDYGAPTLTATSASSTQNSITVNGKLNSYGAGTTSADLTACAYTNSGYTGTPICSSASELSGTIPSGGKDYSLTISGLNPNTQYYIKVTADNGHKTANATISNSGTKTTVAATMTITADRTSPVIYCYGATTTVKYTATVTGATPTNYTWTTSGAAGSHTSTTTSNEYTVTVSSEGTINVSCTANGTSIGQKTNKAIVAQRPSTSSYIIAIVTDFNARTVEVKSTNCVESNLVWKDANGTTQATGKYFTAPADGFYTVSGSTTTGCPTTKSVYIGEDNPGGCLVPNGEQHSNETYNSSTKLVTQVTDAGFTYDVLSIAGVCITKTNIRRITSPTTGEDFLDNQYSSYTESHYKINTAAGNEGVLYNWHAAMDLADGEDARNYGDQDLVYHRGVCPEGWHVPTTTEWGGITTNYNASQVAVPTAGDMQPWQYSGNTGAAGNPTTSQRNITGLGVYPAGGFGHDQGVYNQGYDADFWTATSKSNEGNTKAFSHYCFYYNDWFGAGEGTKDVGRSLRCVRD